jgi:enamine deaminase RidA (YjgF/YER057c/UK114 family)
MKYSCAPALAALLIFGLLASTLPAAAKKKKKDEEITQTLEVLPDPPAAIKAETARLVFHTSPLTARGLLSQQVRDSIKALWRAPQLGQIIKLRAFVAGTGDMRRVQAIVAEMFSEKKLPLPVISTIQVGALPMEGAQVLLEATSVTRKPVNPHGLAFLSGQAATAELKADQPSLAVAPLTVTSLNNLRKVLEGINLAPPDVLRVSCFVSSLDDYSEVNRLVRAEYPQAATTIVQTQRSPSNSIVECEAVARLRKPPAKPVELVNPPGVPASPNYSQAALVNVPFLTFSGTQLAFRAQDADIRLAFERLQHNLEPVKTPIQNTIMSSVYPLSGAIANRVRAIRFEFYDKARPPASTMLPFEGLPSLDASFAIDVVAVPEQ